MYKVYKLLDPETFQVRYIGITKQTLENRLQGHYNHKDNPHMQNWLSLFKRKGKRVIIELIVDNLSLVDACKEEVRLIEQIGRSCLGLGSLINISSGGNIPPDHTGRKRDPSVGRNISVAKLAKNFKHKQESKDKISRKLSGRVGGNKGYTMETHPNIKASAERRRGMKRSIETKRKIGDSKRGRKVREEVRQHLSEFRKEQIKNGGYKPPINKRKVYEFTVNFSFYKEWDSVQELTKHYNICRGTFAQWISKGYIPKNKERKISLTNPK